MAYNTKYRVAVLMGGFGGEREVSLKSGRAVLGGLRDAGHEAIPYDVTDPSLPGLEDLLPEVAFVALHGSFGEDGGVQQALEEMGIPYTGSGPEASRLGMDKLASKRLFVRHSVPTADYFVVAQADDLRTVAGNADAFGYPFVCKPACSGSSLGISIVRAPGQLEAALAAARACGETVLVERYIRGREFTAGVLDGEPLPLVELTVGREFFDYEAKYHDESTRYIIPVALLHTLYRRATDAALRAYHALGCRHMARVDMLYGFDGGLYVLEANTIPGFTPRSLLPMAAAEAGIPFAQLCDRVIRAAVRDAARRRQRLSA
jgi:D-alanine-D-alanine ligase